MTDTNTNKEKSQSDKFIEAAKELGTDEDAARWEGRLRKIVKHKPQEEEGRG